MIGLSINYRCDDTYPSARLSAHRTLSGALDYCKKNSYCGCVDVNRHDRGYLRHNTYTTTSQRYHRDYLSVVIVDFYY